MCFISTFMSDDILPHCYSAVLCNKVKQIDLLVGRLNLYCYTNMYFWHHKLTINLKALLLEYIWKTGIWVLLDCQIWFFQFNWLKTIYDQCIMRHFYCYNNQELQWKTKHKIFYKYQLILILKLLGSELGLQ